MTNSLPKEIKDRHEARVKAVLNVDEKALRELLSDDLVIIHGGGSIDTKESYIEKRLRKDYIIIKQIRYDEINTKVSPDMILVYGNVEVIEYFPQNMRRPAGDNRPVKVGDHVFPVRISEIWRKEKDGAWRMSHSHTCVRSSPNSK